MIHKQLIFNSKFEIMDTKMGSYDHVITPINVTNLLLILKWDLRPCDYTDKRNKALVNIKSNPRKKLINSTLCNTLNRRHILTKHF